jgi:hypothetical protein
LTLLSGRITGMFPRRGRLSLVDAVYDAAGVVLAATFSVLVSFPLVITVHMGTVVAVGILIDTLVVRTFPTLSTLVRCRQVRANAATRSRTSTARAPVLWRPAVGAALQAGDRRHVDCLAGLRLIRAETS